MFLNLESNVLSLLSSNLKIRRTAFTLSYGFLHIYLPTIFNLRKASFHATFQIWCQTGVKFPLPVAGSIDFTGLFSPMTSSSGKVSQPTYIPSYRFKSFHSLAFPFFMVLRITSGKKENCCQTVVFAESLLSASHTENPS